jgi:hypothetical protein
MSEVYDWLIHTNFRQIRKVWRKRESIDWLDSFSPMKSSSWETCSSSSLAYNYRWKYGQELSMLLSIDPQSTNCCMKYNGIYNNRIDHNKSIVFSKEGREPTLQFNDMLALAQKIEDSTQDISIWLTTNGAVVNDVEPHPKTSVDGGTGGGSDSGRKTRCGQVMDRIIVSRSGGRDTSLMETVLSVSTSDMGALWLAKFSVGN